MDRFIISNLGLKNFLRWILDTKGEAGVKLAEIGRERGRLRDTPAISLFQFLSLFHKDGPFWPQEMGMKQVLQVPRVWIAMSL